MSLLDFQRLRNVRAEDPASIVINLKNRRRRTLLRGDGKLFIVAADHAARGALGVRDDSMAMGDRYSLLERLSLALSRPGVDGVLGTPDIIEDLAILGALDDKVALGSMNRGGLKSSIFEMDDRFTGYDIEGIKSAGLDFAKILLRINLRDPRSVATIECSARMVTAAAASKLPIMIEPFMSDWLDGRIVNDLSTEAVVKSVVISSGIGASSAWTWLKLPVVKHMERVMESTTLPTLLLGGDPSAKPDETYAEWAKALRLPGVRGLVVGRTLLYPADGDVTAAIDTGARLVHGITHL